MNADTQCGNIAIDIRPFTIFEGLNDMLYAEIYDQFVRATAEEKEAGIKLDKNQTLLDRLQTDVRFAAVARDYALPEDIRSFLQEHTLTDACALQKVFIGKIIARLFVFVQEEHEDTTAFLLNDIRKDILDCRYCG